MGPPRPRQSILPAEGLPRSSSLHQIKGLIGRMQSSKDATADNTSGIEETAGGRIEGWWWLESKSGRELHDERLAIALVDGVLIAKVAHVLQASNRQ